MKGLGPRIRALRLHRQLTMAELAQRTRIDKATLSRIETGKMTGTLDSHVKIAQALAIRLPELYEGMLAQQEVQRQARAREKLETFFHSAGAIAELLTTGNLLRKKLMPLRLKLTPKARTETEEYPPYTERFLYVLHGELKITVGSATHVLKTDESLYFDASLPHHFSNPSSSPTRCLSIMTPTSL